MEDTEIKEDVYDWEHLDEDTVAQYEKFNLDAYNKGKGYSCPNFPLFDKYMEGLESGLYMFAGESNHGKSRLVQNLLWDFIKNEENHLFGLYFTLDDTANEFIPHLIAMTQSIPIAVGSKPQRFQDMVDMGDQNAPTYSSWLNKREAGLQELIDMKRRFKIYDGKTITCGEDILETCIAVKAQIGIWDEKANIIVVIDSLSDITFRDKTFKTDKELNDHIAKQVKKWAVEILDCPILGTLHLRKIDQNRRPTVADVKESGRYVYEASYLGLIYNDVSRNKQSAKIALREEGSDELMPVIELDWAKNKKSSFKGRTYHSFITNYSQVKECDEGVTERFNTLIYSI